jgi:hypothetical protein
MSYQNFAVEVTALSNARYRIAIQSAVGEASAEVDAPYTPDALASILKILAREQRISREEEARISREFGARLFEFLFRSSPDLSNAYFASLREAMNSDGIRIRLSVENAGALSTLPWEFLRDPTNDFLALSRRTPVIHYAKQLVSRPPAPIALPLRVLVMISAPADFPTLDVEGEWKRLQEATKPLRDNGLIELERLDEATLIALQRKLRTGVFHVFHYIGHSDYDAASQQGLLVFENERDNHKGQIITGAALSRELAEESTIRLVVLNSCHSASRPPADALTGIASGLVARGIAAVVAMQYAISDGAAKAFAEEFYRALSEMLPLEAAMSEARRAIANRVGNNEWATPVLYLRAADGVLFQSETATTNVSPSQRITPPVLPETHRNQNRLIAWGLLGIIALALVLFGASRLLVPPEPPPTPTLTPTVPPTAVVTPVPAALPDLQIGRLRVSPSNPAPGQIFILNITITNAGNAPSGAFTWAWDASTTQPVMQNSLFGEIDNIAPGASKNISFPFSYGWWGSYSSQLRVDVQKQVVESDPLNNTRFFQVDLSLQPLEMDFSLLPPSELVEPPMMFSDNPFSPWFLRFAANATSLPECVNTPLMLTEAAQTDVILSISDAYPACRELPLTISIGRAGASAAVLEILPEADGIATFSYFRTSTQPIFQSLPIEVQAGQPVELRTDQVFSTSIGRIEVSVPRQAVQLTRLALSAPNP